jgi:hypothetical protein
MANRAEPNPFSIILIDLLLVLFAHGTPQSSDVPIAEAQSLSTHLLHVEGFCCVCL